MKMPYNWTEESMVTVSRTRCVLLGGLLAANVVSLAGSVGTEQSRDSDSPDNQPAPGSGLREDSALVWEQLPSLPQSAGLGGPFAGVSNGRLLVAGGANFPHEPPWQGGHKLWYDTIYALSEPDARWQEAGKLGRPLAYGVSLTTPAGVVCIGGSDARQHYRDVFLLKWSEGRVQIKPLPALPRPMANGCGALLDNTIYIAGGIEAPNSTNALLTFWALGLASPTPAWHELLPWPGPPRMLAVAAALDGAFYLASGTDLYPDRDGKPARRYLTDAYRYRPGAGWKRLADIPRPAVAAPSPAPALGKSRFLVLSGDDGSKLDFTPLDQHPGFATDILAYDTLKDAWASIGKVPATQVTVPVALWRGRYVLPNGEVRPGVRTPAVWSFKSRR